MGVKQCRHKVKEKLRAVLDDAEGEPPAAAAVPGGAS
jgi:hypothetical protein